MKLTARLSALLGLSAALLVGTPAAQRSLTTAEATAEVRNASPAPAKPVRTPIAANPIVFNIRREEEEYSPWGWFRRMKSKRRYNRRAHRAAMNNWG